MKKQKTQSKLIVALTAVVLLLVALSATLTFAYFTASSNATSDSMTFGELSINTEQELASSACAHAGGSSAITTLVPGCEITIGTNDALSVKGNIDTLLRASLSIDVWQTKRLAVVADIADEDDDGVDDETGVKVGDLIDVKSGDTLGDAPNQITAALIPNTEIYAFKTTAIASGNDFAGKVFGYMADVAGWTYNSADNKYYYNSIVNAKSTTTAISIPFTTTIGLSATELGNLWQNARIQINVTFDAIQAEHLTFVNTANSNTVTKMTVVGTVDLSASANAATTSTLISDVKTGNAVPASQTSVKGSGTAAEQLANMIAQIAKASAWGTVANEGVVTP